MRNYRLMLLVFFPFALWAGEGNRPNIVWITTEDNSVHYLDLYSEGGAPMPNVERLAKEGIVFQHAFSNAPVCSTARSTIISGCYGPRNFAQFHRSSIKVPMPEGLFMFPYYLRQAGYYTTNNSKEDYNYISQEGVWDESSGRATYRNRKDGQPFFHVQNFGTTHEGRLHFSREQMEREATETDVETVPVFPIHPDTELFRYTNARYRDLHRKADQEIGKFLSQLETDGLMEDTIIFFYGDHGGVLPGSKGYIYERGLHVPMVVYIPNKWRHLAPAAPGSEVEGFVQFIDLGPTVLNLAGLRVPSQMDGKPFLGSGVKLRELNQRDFTFSYADRFDEKFDFVRAVRKGKFKYMRNFQPFNVDGLQNNYRYRMLAYKEWRDQYLRGELSLEQAQFFSVRPVEALFDLEADPFELNNLADDPAYLKTLFSMRELLRNQIVSMPDLSFIPEPILYQSAAENPTAFGWEQQNAIADYLAIADLSLLSFEDAERRIKYFLAAKDPLKRYWAIIAATCFGSEASSLAEAIGMMAETDDHNLVRMRAAEFLGLTGLQDPRPALIRCLKGAETLEEAALILNTIVLVHDSGNGYRFELTRDWVPSEWLVDTKSNVARRFEYIEGLHP